ncbi:RNase adapter RapZ [Longitalea luteola]|uniref:RNase adapter RapZ n=1 Tax=Longitalea luteola TaxID=2812563 RepID=UPI001A97D1B5|nr:AAA family ATPase [Longitalea luteola]
MNTTERYIITGGPGAGKTSLLHALADAGYFCSQEASRRLIAELVATGSDCLPWINLSGFAEKVLDRMIDSYKQTTAYTGTTFFDRGIPDIIAYLKAAALPVHDRYYTALQHHPYQPLVFILPPWQAIYVNDAERWQTFDEAVHLYINIRETYKALGFTLVEVPPANIHNRVNFIRETINQQHANKPHPGGLAQL